MSFFVALIICDGVAMRGRLNPRLEVTTSRCHYSEYENLVISFCVNIIMNAKHGVVPDLKYSLPATVFVVK